MFRPLRSRRRSPRVKRTQHCQWPSGLKGGWATGDVLGVEGAGVGGMGSVYGEGGWNGGRTELPRRGTRGHAMHVLLSAQQSAHLSRRESTDELCRLCAIVGRKVVYIKDVFKLLHGGGGRGQPSPRARPLSGKKLATLAHLYSMCHQRLRRRCQQAAPPCSRTQRRASLLAARPTRTGWSPAPLTSGADATAPWPQ